MDKHIDYGFESGVGFSKRRGLFETSVLESVRVPWHA